MVAKQMRCSVKAAFRLEDEEFEAAFISAAAINKARPHLIDRQIEEAEKKRAKERRGRG